MCQLHYQRLLRGGLLGASSAWAERMRSQRGREVWRHMISRCENPRHPAYPSYGGRGITVCERWRESFAAFLADMGPSPEGHSLERVNNDGNYEPGNVRWATPEEQARNRRSNHTLTINGETRCVSEWAHISGVLRLTILRRLAKGWNPKAAISTPSRQTTTRGKIL